MKDPTKMTLKELLPYAEERVKRKESEVAGARIALQRAERRLAEASGTLEMLRGVIAEKAAEKSKEVAP